MSLISSFINNVMGQTVSEAKTDHHHDVINESTSNSQNESGEGESDKHAGHVVEGKPLEWKFIDFTKAQRSPIFDVDPVMLKKFIGHNVTVLSISRQEFHGCCLAIDPVSLSVILAKRINGGNIRVITVPGYYLAKIRVDSNSVPAENSVSVNDLDVAELYHAPSLYSENKNANSSRIPKGVNVTDNEGSSLKEDRKTQVSQDAPTIACSESLHESSRENVTVKYNPEQVLKRKEDLMAILVKHRMPVSVKEEILEIPGVKIKPPYTIETCDTNNQMIKKKLEEFIKYL